MERVSWINNGSKFTRVEGNIKNIEAVPRGVYNVNFSQMEGWFLTKASDEFTFSFKIYDMETEFINHVIEAYNNTKGNLGVLLNGIRGTGKTINAKLIANKLNLPVIIVKSIGEDNTPLIEYLASFNFDCVLFFDEFEKNFSKKDCSILQIMDGVYSFEHRKVFLLTTNETRVNENLLSRPSRIRYIKQFGNIGEDVVRAYLADNLDDKSKIEDIVSFVDSLTISTIDILKTIVEDINIFGFDKFFETSDMFNVKKANYNYWCKFISLDRDTIPTISEFVRDVKKIETLKKPSRYELSNEEFQKAMEVYHKEMPDYSLSSRTIYSQKSFKSLKVGDVFGYWPEDGERVMEIDYEKGVVKTEREYGNIQLYFVEDKDSKPSILGRTFGYGSYSCLPNDEPDDEDCDCGA